MATPHPAPQAGITAYTSQAMMLAIRSLSGSIGNQLQVTSVQAALRLDLPPFVGAPTPRHPRWFVGQRGTSLWIGIAGVEDLSQASQVFLGSQFFVTYGNVRLNGQFLIAAEALFDELGSPAAGTWQNIVIGGHSYGGGVAEVLGLIMHQKRVGRTVSIITYGSPRPGDFTFPPALKEVPLVRWMTAPDPVPRFPPHQAEAPAFYAVAPQFRIDELVRWEQPGGGVVVYPTGFVEGRSLPPQALPITDLELIAWALGVKGFFNPMHSADAYLSALFSVSGAQAPLSAGEVNRLLTNVSGERPLPLDPPGAGSELVSEVQSLLGESGMSVLIPLANRPSIVKVTSKIFRVQLGSHIIVTGMSRSNARAFRKALYKMQRVLQTEKDVNVTEFGTALAGYLAAATNPAGGFVPVLGTMT